VGGKTFAGLTTRHEGAMWSCDRDERPLLVASNPDAYRLTSLRELARVSADLARAHRGGGSAGAADRRLADPGADRLAAQNEFD